MTWVANGRAVAPDDDAANLVGMIEGEMARAESTKTSRRVMRAKAPSLTHCLYSGGRPPFGFKRIDKQLWAQDPKAAKAIRWAYVEIVERGGTYYTVAKEWNGRGIVTPMKGNTWTTGKVRAARCCRRSSRDFAPAVA